MKEENKIKEIKDSLIISNEGMSCDEFTILITAGPPRKKMPPSVQERMNQHENACLYYQSKAFHQSALDIVVTGEAEQVARDIIEKYRKLDESKLIKDEILLSFLYQRLFPRPFDSQMLVSGFGGHSAAAGAVKKPQLQ